MSSPTRSTRRKSAAIALSVLGLAGLSLASAATLSLDAGTLQAGTADQVGCQGDAEVAVAFGTDWSAAASDYVVSDVELSGIAAACATEEVGFTLLDGTGAALFTSQDTAADSTVTLDVTADEIRAQDVDGVAVVIH